MWSHGNKVLELSMFKKGPRCVVSTNLDWTLQKHRRDHWGITFYLCILGVTIIELAIYDIRHADD